MCKLMFIPFQHSLISMGSDGQTAPHNAYKLDNVWSAQVELSGSKVTHSVKKTLLGFIAKTTGGNMTSTHIHICFHLLLPTQSAVSTRDTKIIWNTKGGGVEREITEVRIIMKSFSQYLASRAQLRPIACPSRGIGKIKFHKWLLQ